MFPLSKLPLYCFIIVVFAFSLSSSIVLASEPQCDGEHLLSLEKSNDNIECAILIDDELIFPRNIVARGEQIWLVDKGSNLFVNGKKNGALYRYQKSGNGYTRTLVLSNLDDPSDIDIRQHADKQDWVYFTTRRKIQRINASLSEPDVEPETIISDLATYGWHKLAAIHLTQDALYLTVPSATDHCEVEGIPRLVEYPCSEEENGTAVIREYTFEGDKLSQKFKVVAHGLRDALAVQIGPKQKKLIVADNGWDQVDLNDTQYQYATTPHDEIDIIDLSNPQHFGWPYCFDDTLVTPPYQRYLGSCEDYQAPHILLQAHSAPLNMMYFGRELLVNLHGNNKAGGKTVSFKLDDEGMPLATSELKLNWHYNTSEENSLIGRPFGLSRNQNNHLLVTDDWNHQLIKIVFKPK